MNNCYVFFVGKEGNITTCTHFFAGSCLLKYARVTMVCLPSLIADPGILSFESSFLSFVIFKFSSENPILSSGQTI